MRRHTDVTSPLGVPAIANPSEEAIIQLVDSHYGSTASVKTVVRQIIKRIRRGDHLFIGRFNTFGGKRS